MDKTYERVVFEDQASQPICHRTEAFQSISRKGSLVCNHKFYKHMFSTLQSFKIDSRLLICLTIFFGFGFQAMAQLSDCPSDITYQCDDEVPAAAAITVLNDPNADVSFFETNLSDATSTVCELETPGSVADGNLYWAVTLPGLPNGITANFVWESDAEIHVSDDELLVTGTVVNVDNANHRFYVHFAANARASWTEWNGQLTTTNPAVPRRYKDTNGHAVAGGTLWTTWDFFEVNAADAYLVGLDGLAGSYLSMNHAPTNYLFGVQLGEAANDKTADYGMSSWFTLNGTVLGSSYTGQGDISTNADCDNSSTDCAYEIHRQWTAVDADGMLYTCEQVITVSDTTAPELSSMPADATVQCDNVPAAPVVTAMDNCLGAVTVAATEVINGSGCEYTIVRTWSAMDDCGNSVLHTQTLTVVDTMAPWFIPSTVPADVTVECDNIPAVVYPNTTDNCSDLVTITLSETEEGDDCNKTITRTWTINDGCDNTTSTSQVITVVDTTAPEFIPSSVPADVTVECGNVPAVVYPNTTDNCQSPVSIALNESMSGDDCEMIIEREFVINDMCGNSNAITQTITVVDSTSPEFIPSTIPADVTVECGNIPAVEYPNTTDNCSMDVSIELIEEEVAGDCPQEMVITRTFVINDGCDNTNSVTQTITVVDTTAPVIEVPAETVVDISCDEYVCGYQNGLALQAGLLSPTEAAAFIGCTQSLFAQYDILPIGVSDNCDTDVQWVPGAFIPVIHDECTTFEGSTNVKVSFICWFNATDACGNAADSVYTVLNIVDHTAPVLEGVPADMTVECSDLDRNIEVTATDDCDIVPVNYEEIITNQTCTGSYTLTCTWSAEDACGNSVSESQVITVVDNTAPEFDNLPADAAIECDEAPLAVETVTASDLCDPNAAVSMTEERIDGDCDYNYTVERTYTATDDCGNSAVYVQTIVVSDTTAPEFGAIEPYITVECDMIPEAADVEATDNCGTAVVTVADSGFSGGCQGAIQRTYTATDECGNTATYTQIINVIDNTAPVLSSLPADMTVECDAIPAAAVLTATDNCDEELEVIAEEMINGAGCEYTIVRTWYVIDDCNNETEHMQTLTVVDTTAPNFIPSTVPADITIECGTDVPFADPNTTDNCQSPVTITVALNEVAGDCPAEKVITRTWTINDECGNTNSISQVITIVDTTAPVLSSLPENLTAECDAIPAAEVLTATDNCDDSVDVVMTESPAGSGCEYTMERVYTATDDCGNSTVHIQTITIMDTTAPEFIPSTVPMDMTVECDAVPAVVYPNTTDNCQSPVSIVLNESQDGDACETIIVREYVINDMCGNSNSVTQIITVLDTTAPEFGAIEAYITVECDSIPAPADVPATDNCSTPIVTVADAGFSGGCQGAIERTYTATDDCGNTVQFTQIINVVDMTAPVLDAAPADLTIGCDESAVIAVLEATDNCGEATVSTDSETTAGDCPGETITVITWTAIDECNNSSTVSQTITKVDNEAPEFLYAPENITVDCEQVPAAEIVDAYDNCSSATVAMVETSTTGCPYTITRTYTATDECDNTAVHIQTITVTDTSLPTFDALPLSMTAECDAIPAAAVVTASDNCDASPVVEMVETTVGAGCEYAIERTYTATDNCDNSAVYVQTITVVDTTAPNFIPSTVPADETVECDAIPAPADPNTTDNCQSPVSISLVETEAPGQCDGEKVITRTWTINDMCGNTNVASQIITVIDTTAPEFSSIPEDATYTCGDIIPDAPVLTGTDNCSQNISIDFEEVIEGNTNPYLDCSLTTEQPSPALNNAAVWSMFLQAQGSSVQNYYVLDGNGAQFTETPIGGGMFEGHITGTLVNPNNTDEAFMLDVYLIQKTDYAGWTSQLTTGNPSIPRVAKTFNGVAQPGDELTWDYWLLDGSRSQLVGMNDYAGDILDLAHAPSNHYFGFEVGMNANNYSAGYGIGGWFSYEGTIGGVAADGNGDIAVGADCPPCEYTISRTWILSDDCGNSIMTSQLITVNAPAPVIDGGNVDMNAQPIENEQFGFMSAYPNPTGSIATLVYKVATDTDVTIEVLNTNSKSINTIFDGRANAGADNYVQFDGTNYENGLYMVKLITIDGVYYQKVMLTK